MDCQQIKMHLKILASRIQALEHELSAATRDGQRNKLKQEALLDAVKTVESNREVRVQTIDAKYGAEIEDMDKQIRLSDKVLEKKKEERQVLLSYLSNFNLDVKHLEDLRDFDWVSIKKIAESYFKAEDDLYEQSKRAEILDDHNQRARQRVSEISEQLTSTTLERDRLGKSLGDYKQLVSDWKNIIALQTKRLSRVQNDNERLNLLIKQCVVNNETTSEYVTRNVHAKCHSFMNSENSEELLGGLIKFKTRQERIIKLLKHKEKRLGRETNKLQVARDQTQDQLKFYMDIISDRRNMNLAMAYRNSQSNGDLTQEECE